MSVSHASKVDSNKINNANKESEDNDSNSKNISK